MGGGQALASAGMTVILISGRRLLVPSLAAFRAFSQGWRWGGADWEGREATHACPAPLPDGASGCRGPTSSKGQQRTPSGQKGAGTGCSGPRCQGHSQPGVLLPHCSSPDSSSDCSVPLLSPADSTVHSTDASLFSLAREPRHHQATGQARNQQAASKEPSLTGRTSSQGTV